MGGPSSEEFVNAPKPKADIFEAAAWNDLDAIKCFIEEKGVYPNATNSLNQTAAHLVVYRSGAKETLDYLFDKDPAVVSIKDKWGQTVLHIAMHHGYLDLVKYLVDERNASLYQQIDTRYGHTAVHVAAEESRMMIMMYFVEEKRCDINVRNLLGEPPIFAAAANNHVDMVKYLVSKGADATLVNKHDDNILFAPAKQGFVDVPRCLLDTLQIPLDINYRNLKGETVLHAAVKYKQTEFVKYLVESKNIDVDIFDNLDRTAVYVATNMNDLDMVKYLVEHGANPKLDDCDGRTAAEIATDQGIKDYLSNLKPQNRSRRNVPFPYFSLWERGAVSKQPKRLDGPTIEIEELRIAAAGPTIEDAVRSNDLVRRNYQNTIRHSFTYGGELDSFLTIANIIANAIFGTVRNFIRIPVETLLSPPEIVKRRIDPLAAKAINIVP